MFDLGMKEILGGGMAIGMVVVAWLYGLLNKKIGRKEGESKAKQEATAKVLEGLANDKKIERSKGKLSEDELNAGFVRNGLMRKPKK